MQQIRYILFFVIVVVSSFLGESLYAQTSERSKNSSLNTKNLTDRMKQKFQVMEKKKKPSDFQFDMTVNGLQSYQQFKKLKKNLNKRFPEKTHFMKKRLAQGKVTLRIHTSVDQTRAMDLVSHMRIQEQVLRVTGTGKKAFRVTIQ